MSRAHLMIGLLLAALPVASEAQFPSANPPYQAGFPKTLNGLQVEGSPVALGDLNKDGLPDIVVGARDGKVYAYTGFGVKLWEYDTGNMGISGQAAIGDVDGDGFNEVVVGAAQVDDQNGADGGLYVISHTGQLQCAFQTADFGNGHRAGVYSSPALADLDRNDGGLLEILFGSWDHHIRAIHHDCQVLWDLSQIPPPPALADVYFDTVWSSPAIGDVNRDGQLDVVIGTDSRDNAPNFVPVGGGVFAFDGKTGALLAGFPTTEPDDVIWSSPALGDLTGNGRLDIAVGTGRCWEVPGCAVAPAGVQPVDEALFAWDDTGNSLPGWPIDLKASGNLGQGTYAMASAALADVDNDGELEVVINTIEPGDINGGQLYVFNPDGSTVPGWPVRPAVPADCMGHTVSYSSSGSPVVADVAGDSDLEIILPSNWDLVIFDRHGNQLSQDSCVAGDFILTTNGPVGMAAVGDIDGDGDLEVVAAGFATQSPPVGAIYVWDFPGQATPDATPWPTFRRTPNNQARVGGGGEIFADGFESGDTSAWQ